MTFDPLSHIFPDLIDMQNYTFLNQLDDPIILSPIWLKSNQLENMTTVLKVNDLLLFDLYLENETLYEFQLNFLLLMTQG